MPRGGFRMKRSVIDEHAATELDLYIENESQLYNQKKSILANLKRKKAKGIYDPAKAAKLWEYWVAEGARRYTKEHGSPGQSIDQLGFNKATREHVATQLEQHYRNENLEG
jgi:hypothetical protein